MYYFRKFYELSVTLFIIILISSCSKTNLTENNKNQLMLNIYNWEDYIGSETIELFTEKTGITVNIDYYEDEEIMLGFIISDLSRYDLVVASDDMVGDMIRAKILAPLKKSEIPNLRFIDPAFTGLPFDPEQKYSIPYLWGTTGMVINTKYIKEDSYSWSILFNKDYSKKIAMLNNSFEVISAPLKMMKQSINTIDLNALENSKKMLTEQNRYIQGYFDAVTMTDLLIEEELWAAQIYSGEGLYACDINSDLEYIIPVEGAPIWLDNFVIPRDAPHYDAANEFLNFILEPQINGAIASELWYATANKEALKYVEEEVLNSDSVYPDNKTLNRCEYYNNSGSPAIGFINKLWIELENMENNT